MTVKVEITFMVYRQAGVGNIETREFEVSQADLSALSSGNKNENPQLKSWALNQFPSAKKVQILTTKKL